MRIKCCLPSERVAIGIVQAENLADALATVPCTTGARMFEALAADAPIAVSEHRVSGLRQWRKQLHGGEQRWLESSVAAVAS